MHGPEQEVYFPQDHRPGREAAFDFTNCNDLGVTIGGEPFAHLLFELALSYSGWRLQMVAAMVRSIQTGSGHAEYTPIGHSTSLAARMQALAPIGSIATTQYTQKLCEGFFTFKPLVPTRIKGVSEPVNVVEVTGLGPLRTRLQVAAQRGLTRFVGRTADLEQMKRALEQAKSGHGQIVAAIGDPGVGKSRLFFEFKAIAQSGCLVLEAYSVSHGKASANLPVIDLLKSYFKIATEDDERARRENTPVS